jgi:hypothetical protein
MHRALGLMTVVNGVKKCVRNNKIWKCREVVKMAISNRNIV